MERVLYNLHSKFCSIALRRTSSKTRSLAEHALLLVALCGFGVLIVSHLSFVHHRPSNLYMRWPSSRSIPAYCLSSIPGFRRDADVTHILLPSQSNKSNASVAYTYTYKETTQPPICTESDKDVCREQESMIENSISQSQHYDIVLSYSATKGFLFLPSSTCSEHNISTQYVLVSTSDAHCFGEPFLQSLVFQILGTETVVLNWLVAFHERHGFVHNPRTKGVMDLSDYNNQVGPLRHLEEKSQSRYRRHPLLFKGGVILTSVFLFFITTTLVSFTLRETQDRMLQFTFQLQAHVRANEPLGQLIGTHVIENLVFVPIMVGMIFFLIEFYGGDKFLAFSVLSIVWVSEVFSIVAIRSIQGMQFFPKIFFLLFTLFHVYFFSCPFGFSYTALASTACFMLHSMVFFWNRYELPAMAHGFVTMENPRMMGATSSPSFPFLPEDVGEEPDLPLVPPRHPLVIQNTSSGHSYRSSSSLGRNSTSRTASSIGTTGVPFRDDGDDDEEGSYMYFMSGEVVMPREQNMRQSPSVSTYGSLEQNEVIIGTTIGSGPDSTSRATTPEGILAATPMIADDAPSSSTQAIPITESVVGGTSPLFSSLNEVDVNLTPRVGSSSRTEIDGDQVRKRPDPFFPFWKFGRQ